MFNIGDYVELAPTNNGSAAFSRLQRGLSYQVEDTRGTCSYCRQKGVSPPANGGTVKIKGAFTCAGAFVASNGAGATSGASVAKKDTMKRDPGRDVYGGDIDFFDTLPDATPEEMARLPTLEQINQRDLERFEKSLKIERSNSGQQNQGE